MCGRIFCLFSDPKELLAAVKEAGVEAESSPYFNYKGPNYNVCPTQFIPVLDSQFCLQMQPWGFKLSSQSSLIVNARCDEIYEKRTFRDIIDYHRCIVIISGYFEWHQSTTSKKKEAYAFRPRDHKVCFMAALRHPSSGAVVLITREATEKLSHIHTRMPLLLRSDSVKEWLQSGLPFSNLKVSIVDAEEYCGARDGFKDSLIIDAEALAPYVNSITNTGPECLHSLKAYKEESFQKGIGKFFPKKRPANES